MKQTVLLVGFILILTTLAQSQNSPKKEKIKALFAVMHQDSTVIKTIDAMTASMVNNMTKMLSDPKYSSQDIDVSKLSKRLMEKSMQRSKENALKLLNEDMVDIYDKYFSIEEIDDFTKFYKSTSGQKMIAHLPDISKDVMAVMSTKYQADFQQTIMKDIEEITNELRVQMNSKEQ